MNMEEKRGRTSNLTKESEDRHSVSDGNFNTDINEADDFDQSEEATKAALLELIKYIAYMCAKRDLLDFYNRFLDSLKQAGEDGKNEE